MKSDLIFSTRKIIENEGLTFSKKAPVESFIRVAGQENEKLQDLVNDCCISGNCAVNVEFSVGGEQILLEAGISGEWETTCSRCLNPHSVKYQNGFEETYPVSQESIDIREDVRQMIILSFPTRSLCKPNCAGLCSGCGKDLNLGACVCKKVAR